MIKDFLNKINVYNLMIFNLILFSIIGIIIFGYKKILLQLILAVFTAGVLDNIIEYLKTKEFRIAKSGIISGFFIALVLSENQAWYVPVVASIMAILGKNIGQYFMKKFFNYNSHIFNPAMFSIFISILIFKTNDGWWGASNLLITLILGFILLYKFNRFNLSLSFLIVYFIINSIYLTINNSFNYSIFLNSTLYFFAFFMIIEPKTSPTNTNTRIFYGIIAGIIISLMHIFFPYYEFTLGLLLSNLTVPFLNKYF